MVWHSPLLHVSLIDWLEAADGLSLANIFHVFHCFGGKRYASQQASTNCNSNSNSNKIQLITSPPPPAAIPTTTIISAARPRQSIERESIDSQLKGREREVCPAVAFHFRHRTSRGKAKACSAPPPPPSTAQRRDVLLLLLRREQWPCCHRLIIIGCYQRLHYHWTM